jgi:hypothetical protein
MVTISKTTSSLLLLLNLPRKGSHISYGAPNGTRYRKDSIELLYHIGLGRRILESVYYCLSYYKNYIET